MRTTMSVLALFLTACSTSLAHKAVPAPVNVSIVAILSDPHHYEGKDVSVPGALQVDSTLSHLCLDSGSINFVIKQNCIAVKLSSDLPVDQVSAHNDTYVVLTGTIGPPPPSSLYP